MKYKVTMSFEFDSTKSISQQNNDVVKGLIHTACPLCVGFPHPGCHFRNCKDCWAMSLDMACERGISVDAAENVHVERLG